tara:strand:- start:18890 stop:19876 length:987 start_codon:yes stop_codon:yes gene_type:complete
MAMINEVRNTVLAIINKNNYGYLSPQDFNLYAQQAQMDLFEDYFYQYNQWINKENQRLSGTGYADIVKGLVEVIDSFSKEAFLTGGVANTWKLPLDYYLINKIYHYPTLLTSGITTAGNLASPQLINTTLLVTDPSPPAFNTGATGFTVFPQTGSLVVNTDTLQQSFVNSVVDFTTLNLATSIFLTVLGGENYSIFDASTISEVERVSQNKLFYLTSSTLTAPSTLFPAYVLSGNTITVYPTTIQAPGAVKTQYVRYPIAPKWTYNTIVVDEPIFNPSAADFQDFELPLSDAPGLIAKICQYVGVEIREPAVSQFGQNEEVQDNQIQV